MLIGELSRLSGVSSRMLRHYDAVGLLPATGRTHGGYRDYSPDDVRRLAHVELLRSLGPTLAEIATALADPGFDPAPVVRELVARTRQRVAEEQELLARLGRVQAGRPGAWTDVLQVIGLLRALGSPDPAQRQRAALSAVDPDVAALAEAALDEDVPDVAGALQWALARTGDAGVPVLAAALASPDPGRRRRALEGLAKIDSPRSREVLSAVLDHPDPLVRGRAALVRGRQGRVDAVPALVRLVVDGRDDVEAGDVLGALARRRDDPRDADDVARALVAELPDAAVDVRRRLVGALAEVPGDEARRALELLTGDPERGVALTATAVLRRRAEPTTHHGAEIDRVGTTHGRADSVQSQDIGMGCLTSSA